MRFATHVTNVRDHPKRSRIGLGFEVASLSTSLTRVGHAEAALLRAVLDFVHTTKSTLCAECKRLGCDTPSQSGTLEPTGLFPL